MKYPSSKSHSTKNNHFAQDVLEWVFLRGVSPSEKRIDFHARLPHQHSHNHELRCNFSALEDVPASQQRAFSCDDLKTFCTTGD